MDKKVIEGLNSAIKSLRETAEQNNRKRDVVLDEKLVRINKSVETLSERVDALALANLRPTSAKAETRADIEAKEAFLAGVRKGFDKLSAAETKAMIRGNEANPDGGYTVPEAIYNAIVAKVFETSPMRALAGSYSTGTSHLEFPVETGEAASGWVAEEAARPKTANPQIQSVRIDVHELYAEPHLTRQLGEDSMFNIEAFLVDRVSAKFARDEAAAFINGTGTGMPRGVLSYAGATSAYNSVKFVATSTVGQIEADDIFTVVYDLETPYAPGATWQMSRATLAKVRTLKDDNGNYLWQPSLQAGQPSTLAGFPVFQAEDLSGTTAGSDVAIFGDVAQGYAVVDKPGSMIMIRDDITDKRYIKLYTRVRVGGGVIRGEALRTLRLRAAP